MPSARLASPYHMTEMIEAEPAFSERILGRFAAPDSSAARLATAIRTASGAGSPVIVVGSGTSENGAIAVAEILRAANRDIGLPSSLGQGGSPIAVQGFEGGLESVLGGPGGVVIGVSHEGGTPATHRAMSLARDSGATVALISAAGSSPAAEIADISISTDEMDQSWCHTVGYLTPILVATAVGTHLAGWQIPATGIRLLLESGLSASSTDAQMNMATALAQVSRLLVLGSGVDRVAARELTIKVEEGAHLPAAMRDLETMLHGHLAGTDGSTGLVLILADASARGARTALALGVMRACREIGIQVGLIASTTTAGEIDIALTPAGRILVPDDATMPPSVAALVGTAVPLQRLAEQLAIQRGVNPDPIRRDDPRYLAAAAAAG